MFDVRFVVADDLVADFVAGVFVGQHHGRPEDDLAGVGHRGYVDDLGVGELAFDVFDAAFDEALTLAGGVVFGVFLEVAVFARFGDGLDDGGAVYGFELFQFGAQGFGAAGGHGDFVHRIFLALSLSRDSGSGMGGQCSSCRARTCADSGILRAMQRALPPAMVVVWLTL